MISNAQPWDNLKFDENGIVEVQRKFFGTLYNIYSFFALYANIDGFKYAERVIPVAERAELDRWVLSELNSLIKKVEENYGHYEPTRVARLIQKFTINKLSNWHVRLSRRRFWKGEYNLDKIAAYQTLYECLETVSIIAAPIAPFFMDNLFQDLNNLSARHVAVSVHLADFSVVDKSVIDTNLERKMELAQKITSLALSLRKKEGIRVRQPLQKILIPILDAKMKNDIERVSLIILSEINVKEIDYLAEESTVLTKQIKPNFKTLGPKFGKKMKLIASKITSFTSDDITAIETNGSFTISDEITLELTDVEIGSSDIPGFSVATDEGLTVALDITLTDNLKEEGLAREFVNRIQNLRKDNGFEVTDKIIIEIEKNQSITNAINNNLDYICSETLASSLLFSENLDGETIDLIDSLTAKVKLIKN